MNFRQKKSKGNMNIALHLAQIGFLNFFKNKL